MRALLQRVKSASVMVDGAVVGQCKTGVLALVGIGSNDTEDDLDWIVKRILGTKLWENTEGKPWKSNVVAKDYEVLIVSQFTLMGYVKRNRPDYHLAMNPSDAKAMFDTLVSNVKSQYKEEMVSEGEFGAMMDVALVNDGPVTVMLDSKNRENRDPPAVSGAAAGGSSTPSAEKQE